MHVNAYPECTNKYTESEWASYEEYIYVLDAVHFD